MEIDNDTLEREKQELLALMEQETNNLEFAQSIPRRTQIAQAKLSFSQERFWFLDQFAAHRASLNVPIALRFLGQLNRTALKQALVALIARHEILRTTFHFDGNAPTQKIHADLPLRVPLADLKKFPRSEREARASALIDTALERTFDLDKAAALDARLYSLDEDEHILLLNMHHIVTDGWSRGVVVRDLCTLYESSLTEEKSALCDLPIQYADYAEWQRSQFASGQCARQKHYWIDHLQKAPVLNLATDFPRPESFTFRGAAISRLISPDTHRALGLLSQRQNSTLFMTLLAAFKTLLGRYTQQSDIAVGTPIANRNIPELENLIGPFINLLVLRTRQQPSATFREFLAHVRATTLTAFENPDVPFEQLVAELRPQRDSSRNPLFQVMFITQKAFVQPMTLPGLSVQPVRISDSRNGSLVDLTMFLVERLDGFRIGIEYNSDLFSRSRITRIMDDYAALLQRIAVDPDATLVALYENVG